jgi:hypothetical protein
MRVAQKGISYPSDSGEGFPLFIRDLAPDLSRLIALKGGLKR